MSVWLRFLQLNNSYEWMTASDLLQVPGKADHWNNGLVCVGPKTIEYMDVSKNRGKTTKMDGENFMENPITMDDLGGFPIIFGNTHIVFRLPA